ncbi:MAG: 4-(cytidine 5'-diphospho)-2-C-methyl-D-erythritol kinase [Bacteroidaceae bacterium]|nr:4-(cytidine 5'-diphospho)-2-C-methyl-D-erythritol kinase [Bacteroidaceae bacterium]
MRLYPPAKINLGLNIVAKRPDGYHNLETVFYPIWEITDILDVDIIDGDNGKVVLSLEGNPVDGEPEKNLVVKAYQLLSKDYVLPAMSINLTKRIPMQAGMGGGSSDAAFTLKAINELAQLNLSEERLEEYALKLGADAPFFIKCKTCFATGVGEIMQPIVLDLDAYSIRFIKPKDISVSTADAFRNIPVYKPERHCCDIVLNEPIENWKSLLKNDFETTVFAKYPSLAEVKESMYNDGAIYASMTGSGSVIFGIFQKNNYRISLR